MRPTPLQEVRRAVHGRWRSAARAPWNVETVSIDTRTAGSGDLFIAIRGANHDGHDYLPAAAQIGCPAAIVAHDHPLDDELARRFPAGVIGVEDTTVALGELGAFARGLLTGEVIGVTGSVGKTTVKRMIDCVLSTTMTGSAAPKSYNNAVGVPLTLLAAGPADDYVICEMGTNAPGEIAMLTRIVKPTVAVITAVAPCHLERLGSLERIAAEKAAILGALAPGGVGVVFADSDPLNRAVKPYEARLIRFGRSESAQLRLTDVELDGLAQQFEINGRLRVRLNAPGRHNAMNALAALATAMRLGLSESQAVEAIEAYRPAPMRLEALRGPERLVINDAYNANPASVAAALEVLAAAGGDRRVAVLGDMLELGDQAEAFHRQVGREAAAAGVGLLAAVGPLARWIAAGAREAGPNALEVLEYDGADDCAAELATHLRPGDAVLVKGSRGVALERVVEAIAESRSGKEPTP